MYSTTCFHLPDKLGHLLASSRLRVLSLSNTLRNLKLFAPIHIACNYHTECAWRGQVLQFYHNVRLICVYLALRFEDNSSKWHRQVFLNSLTRAAQCAKSPTTPFSFGTHQPSSCENHSIILIYIIQSMVLLGFLQYQKILTHSSQQRPPFSPLTIPATDNAQVQEHW